MESTLPPEFCPDNSPDDCPDNWSDDCPDAALLQKYLLGLLDDDQFEAIDSHISQCDLCAQALADLPRPTDALTRQLSRLPGEMMFGDYELILRLGHGGMGRVYRARHRVLQLDFAVKIIRPELQNDPYFAARFEREVQSLSLVKSPHVVSPVHAGTWCGAAFLVMELVEGSDLDAIIRQRGVLGLADSAEVIAQIATGLAAIHEAGLVHRDLHPGNVLLSHDGVIRIADFGLVRRQDQQESSWSPLAPGLTDARDRLGATAFTAPEQTATPNTVTAAADFFSLGCLWYFLLTGRPLPRDPLSHCVARLDESLSPLPRSCRSVIRHLVDDEPAGRLTSSRELIGSLKRLRGKPRLAALLNEPVAVPPAVFRRRATTVVSLTVLAAAVGFTGWRAMEEPPASPYHELASSVVTIPYLQGGSFARQYFYEAFPGDYTLELVDTHEALLSRGALTTEWYHDCVNNPLSTRIAVMERSPRPSVTVALSPGTHKVSAVSVVNQEPDSRQSSTFPRTDISSAMSDSTDELDLLESTETLMNDHAVVIFYVYPDLAVGPLSISDETVRPGETLTLSFDLTNRGTVTSNVGTLHTFLNPEQPSYVSGMMAETEVPEFKPGETHRIQILVSIPNKFPAGRAFVSVAADAGDTTSERDEQEVTSWAAGKANGFHFVTKKDPKGVPPLNNRAAMKLTVSNSR